MDVSKLNESVDMLKNELGSALIACDIFDASGLSFAGHNSQPDAVALFTDLTSRIENALGDSGFPALGQYYMIMLENNHIVVIALIGELQLGVFVDAQKVNLGLLLNIAVKKAIKIIEEAI